VDLAVLIEQIRQGDETAGAVLVSVVAPRLLGYAGLIAQDLSDADREQVVEEAIEKAIRKIDQYDESRGTFPTWVRAFVRHAAGDWRRQHPGGAVGEVKREREQPVEPPDEQSKQRPKIVALRAIVMSEPLPDQVLLRLRFEEGLSHAQIARELNLTPAAARKRLGRILERLRGKAAEYPKLKDLLKGEKDEQS
jgi:RNA polymerase sigma-70 factor (ECF subfamily)